MNQLLEAVLLGVKQLTPDNLKVAYSFIRKMQPNAEAQNRVDELAWNSGVICSAGEEHQGVSKCLKQALNEVKEIKIEKNEEQELAIRLETCENLLERIKDLQDIASNGIADKTLVASVVLILLWNMSSSESEGWVASIADRIASVMESEDESSGTFKS